MIPFTHGMPSQTVLETKAGKVTLGPATSIDRGVIDFLLNADASVVIYAKGAPKGLVEVVYQDLQTSFRTVLLSATDEHNVRHGARFAFVGKTKSLVYTVDPGPWLSEQVILSGPPTARCEIFRTATILRCTPGRKKPEPLASFAMSPGYRGTFSLAEGPEKVAVLVQGRREPSSALWLVGRKGPSDRIPLGASLPWLYFVPIEAGQKSLFLTSARGESEDSVRMEVPWNAGKSIARGVPSPKPEPRPLGPGESRIPDRIAFLPWDPELISGPEASWTYGDLRPPPFAIDDTDPDWVAKPVWVEFETVDGKQRRQLPFRIGHYAWAWSGETIATLTDGVLSVHRVHKAAMKGRTG